MKSLSLIILLSILFYSCSNKNRKQFEFSGGTLTMALENEPSTYIPMQVMDYYSATVLNQIMEGLVAFDPKTIKIVPRIASEWTKSEDCKIYTFKIRDDILFHPHVIFTSEKDRLLTPEDVVKSFEVACTYTENGLATATYSMLFKSQLKGADEFLNGKAKSISGISVNGKEISIELVQEDHNFLNKLANVNVSIISKKIYNSGNITDVIGTGPFKYSEYVNGDQSSLILVKNEDYYEMDDAGNALPYLDSLVFLFQSRKMEQLDLFETGQLDLIIGLPTSRITRMLEGRIEDFNSKPPKLVLANNPLLETNFYFFNMTDERFKDPRVRKAFNYAIDKEAIGRDVLRNQYYDLGNCGVIPPISSALRGYDFDRVKKTSYSYDPEKAKKLLADAGYPNGENFGSVELRYNINDIHSAVADEFSKQIFKVLGINVNIDGSSFDQLNTDGANGKGDIFRMGWSADYPSPETFLMNFYGKFVPEDKYSFSPINKSRYQNPEFDNYFEQAKQSKKITDQMRLFSMAESELMKDPAIIPLWYTGDIQITQSYLRDFYFNALNYLEFKRVYKKEWTTEEYNMSHQLNDE